ncbi:MAG: RDD family protein [Bacteroidota bacterium]
MRLRFFSTFFFISIGLCLSAQIKVTASLDSTVFLIGDEVHIRIHVAHSGDIAVDAVETDAVKSVDKFDWVGETSWDTISAQQLQKIITVQVFDSGYYKIPNIPVAYTQSGIRRKALSSDLGFTVQTLEEKQEEPLAPIKPIFEENASWTDGFWVVLVVLILAVLILWLLYRLSKGKPQELVAPPVVTLLPHQLALKALEELEAQQLWQQGKTKLYHTRLTQILRQYLEDRFHIPALEMTTRDTVRELQQLDIADHWKSELDSMLQSADLVKFAKADPPASFHESSGQAVRNFVLDTKEELPEEEEAAIEEEAEEQMGVVLSGIGARAAANFIDSLILVIAIIFGLILSFAVVYLLNGQLPENIYDTITPAMSALLIAAIFVFPLLINWYIQAYLVHKNGATPGKQILQLQVVNEEFEFISLGKATLRWLMSMVSYLALYAGYIIALFRGDNRTLHDLVVRTYVADASYKLPKHIDALAPIGKRLTAYLLDMIVLGAVYALMIYLGNRFFMGQALSIVLIYAAYFLFYWLYLAFYVQQTQATVGMKIIGLYIGDREGKTPSLLSLTVRTVIYSILFGHLLSPLSKYLQGLHDHLARTYVYER